MSKSKRVTLFFDGGFREPPKPRATYGVIIISGPETLAELSGKMTLASKMTSHSAELAALFVGLEWLRANLAEKSFLLKVIGDCKPIIDIMTNGNKNPDHHLSHLYSKCLEILSNHPKKWVAKWIPRERNREADALTRGGKKPKRRHSVLGAARKQAENKLLEQLELERREFVTDRD